MKFKSIREAAYHQWMYQTKRARENETDNLMQSFECDWQTWYRKQPNNHTAHYSVFCSIGQWNTNMTDYLTDGRFDNFDLTVQKDKDVLYRYYTRILLLTSEILTDFQDLLSVFRIGNIGYFTRKENDISRNKLNTNLPPNHIQDLFDYINNVSKHKINSLHVCNHHLHLHYEELGTCPSTNAITVSDVKNFFSNDSRVPPQKTADTIVVPKLSTIIETIVNGYQIIDNEFKSNDPAYKNVCNLYSGVSVRV